MNKDKKAVGGMVEAGWMVILTTVSGATMETVFASREDAELARSRALSRTEYIRTAHVHYID